VACGAPLTRGLPLLRTRRSWKASSSLSASATAFSLTGAGELDWGAAITLPLRTAQANAIAAAEDREQHCASVWSVVTTAVAV